jgi:hypothetical protein
LNCLSSHDMAIYLLIPRILGCQSAVFRKRGTTLSQVLHFTLRSDHSFVRDPMPFLSHSV